MSRPKIVTTGQEAVACSDGNGHYDVAICLQGLSNPIQPSETESNPGVRWLSLNEFVDARREKCVALSQGEPGCTLHVGDQWYAGQCIELAFATWCDVTHTPCSSSQAGARNKAK